MPLSKSPAEVPSPTAPENRPDAASETAPAVTVVIVSYNTRDLTLRCLRDLTAELTRAAIASEIWVVDNASRDGSAAAIAREFPGVHLVASEQNLGFGAANNLAFLRARGEFLLLLNSDALVHAGALFPLVDYLRQHPGVGAVGPRLLNEDGSLQVSCWKFPSPARVWLEALGLARLFTSHPRLGDYYRWAHDETRSVDFVIGACLLIRREIYHQIGGFDESFFLYAEETDWEKRVRAAGWDIVFTPDALVTHLGGASGAGEKAKVSDLFAQGQERFILKHFGRRGWLVMRAGLVFGSLVRALCYEALLLTPRRRADTPAKLRAALHRAWRSLAAPAPHL